MGNCLEAADLTGDFRLTFNDVTTFVSAFNAYAQNGTYNPRADFNHDGVIDTTHQTLFTTAYNNHQ